MAFPLPNFNLSAKIWRNNGVGGSYAAPDVTSNCFLSPGRRVTMPFARSTGQPAPYIQTEIGFPKGTDVRGSWNGVGEDRVEVPAGSKRFYAVMSVDDVGKGWANEYRLVMLQFLINGDTNLAGGPFPVPVPLP
jgi:hypothetical protein